MSMVKKSVQCRIKNRLVAQGRVNAREEREAIEQLKVVFVASPYGRSGGPVTCKAYHKLGTG